MNIPKRASRHQSRRGSAGRGTAAGAGRCASGCGAHGRYGTDDGQEAEGEPGRVAAVSAMGMAAATPGSSGATDYTDRPRQETRE